LFLFCEKRDSNGQKRGKPRLYEGNVEAQTSVDKSDHKELLALPWARSEATRKSLSPSHSNIVNGRYFFTFNYFFLTKQALINSLNKGCGRKGLDLNSGWNWVPSIKG